MLKLPVFVNSWKRHANVARSWIQASQHIFSGHKTSFFFICAEKKTHDISGKTSYQTAISSGVSMKIKNVLSSVGLLNVIYVSTDPRDATIGSSTIYTKNYRGRIFHQVPVQTVTDRYRPLDFWFHGFNEFGISWSRGRCSNHVARHGSYFLWVSQAVETWHIFEISEFRELWLTYSQIRSLIRSHRKMNIGRKMKIGKEMFLV